MTTNEVTDFLKLNGFARNQYFAWEHPASAKMSSSPPVVTDAQIYVAPDQALEFAKDILRMAGESIRYPWPSQVASNMTQVPYNSRFTLNPSPVDPTPPQQVTLDTFDLSWGSDWGGAVIRPLSRCDCGAEKCKTTHAHWCSTRS